MTHWPKLITGRIALLLLLNMLVIAVEAQSRAPKTVAIFLYKGVELLDFAGPGEVFSAAGFKVFTVSVDGKELISQGFLTVQPQYSIATSPTPDIIVLPGGNTGPSANDPQVIGWVKKNHEGGSFFMSVCTGAGILAKSDLINGMNVTTFHGYIPGLQAILPTSKVLENTRFVDNGNIITTAGVSAGIDGALHLVSRIKGLDVAKSTAHYMEYDKWNPEQGRVDRKNEFIEQMKNEKINLEKNPIALPIGKSVPYEGELKNLAFELRDKGLWKQEASVLEATIKMYPESAVYSELARVYTKLGKPAPTDDVALLKLFTDGKTDEALAIIEKDRKNFPTWKPVSEDQLNSAAYEILSSGKKEDAIKVFQLNVRHNPLSFNAYDSLGEAYMEAGNKSEAVVNYRKSLELNADNTNAKEMLKKLESVN